MIRETYISQNNPAGGLQEVEGFGYFTQSIKSPELMLPDDGSGGGGGSSGGTIAQKPPTTTAPVIDDIPQISKTYLWEILEIL